MKNQVIIVEDCMIQSTVLRKILEKEQFEVMKIFSSGPEAVSGCIELKPSLVLMDIYLNGTMNGFETAQLIRKEQGMPIIFITALNDSASYLEKYNLERSTILPKPVSRNDLMNAIDHVMNSEPADSEHDIR